MTRQRDEQSDGQARRLEALNIRELLSGLLHSMGHAIESQAAYIALMRKETAKETPSVLRIQNISLQLDKSMLDIIKIYQAMKDLRWLSSSASPTADTIEATVRAALYILQPFFDRQGIRITLQIDGSGVCDRALVTPALLNLLLVVLRLRPEFTRSSTVLVSLTSLTRERCARIQVTHGYGDLSPDLNVSFNVEDDVATRVHITKSILARIGGTLSAEHGSVTMVLPLLGEANEGPR